MQFTNNEIATYLFCAQLSQTKTTPLTIIEWNAVVKSLGENKLQPETLLTITSSELSNTLTQASQAQKARIIKKINARQKLGFSMIELEELVHQGYGIMFRSQMPARIKKLTQKYLPAFFYFAGDPSILQSNRILGIVGARDATDEELSQTANIAREAVSHEVIIISGGARGVDTVAVESALQNGGKAIVYPAEGLARWTKKSSIRQYIMNGKLLLMSAQKIDASFTPSYAMQRNRYIHAPTDAVLVASSKISGKKSSGTWEGILENLKLNWSPIYVIGNSEGVERLIADGNAKEFSTFEDMYKSNVSPKEKTKNHFDEKVRDLIQLAVDEGMDKESIEKTFEKHIGMFFKNLQSIEGIKQKDYKQSQQLDLLDQLSAGLD